MTGITKVEIDDRDYMSIIQANTWQEIYRDLKIGLAVNDGRFVTQVDDRPNINSALKKISR